MTSTADRDPLSHTRKMRKTLHDIKTHLRSDIEKVDEPQLKAMFETSAEVIAGLEKAFHDYEQKSESAWTSSARRLTALISTCPPPPPSRPALIDS